MTLPVGFWGKRKGETHDDRTRDNPAGNGERRKSGIVADAGDYSVRIASAVFDAVRHFSRRTLLSRVCRSPRVGLCRSSAVLRCRSRSDPQTLHRHAVCHPTTVSLCLVRHSLSYRLVDPSAWRQTVRTDIGDAGVDCRTRHARPLALFLYECLRPFLLDGVMLPAGEMSPSPPNLLSRTNSGRGGVSRPDSPLSPRACADKGERGWG